MPLKKTEVRAITLCRLQFPSCKMLFVSKVHEGFCASRRCEKSGHVCCMCGRRIILFRYVLVLHTFVFFRFALRCLALATATGHTPQSRGRTLESLPQSSVRTEAHEALAAAGFRKQDPA